MEMQYFKSKPGTSYDKKIKKYFALSDKWKKVMFKKVSKLLGEKITRMAFDPNELYIDVSQLKNEENKRLFTKDGKLKANNKKANEIREKYIEIVAEEGLQETEDLNKINFSHRIVRYGNLGNPDHIRSFVTSEKDIYFETDFDLEERSNGSVVRITAIEYHEKYLEEIKKQEKVS